VSRDHSHTSPCHLLQERLADEELTSESKRYDQILSGDHILAEDFFRTWKTLFGICQNIFLGDTKLLSTIVRVTTAITNWYIRNHPLRRLNDELIDESSSNRELDGSSSDCD
jgi:hypothetical protein